MKYLVVIEKGPRNFSAYVPDLPGCVSTGANELEVMNNIREAIAGHIETMREFGDLVPEPLSAAAEVEVA